MTARVWTVAFEGVEAIPVEVQVQIASGLPTFAVVGLPDKAVAESRERVRAAMHALGLSLPPKRITINLAPADLVKEGSHFDLPIAVALLVAMGVLPEEQLAGYVVMGELALDGRVMATAGVLPAAIHAVANERGMICPESCGEEAAWADVQPLLAPASLLALINHFKGTQQLSTPQAAQDEASGRFVDMREIKGQESARRALEVAAAGGHNLLMCGPPGAGKSMLAACLPGILPPLDSREILDVSMIASVAGKLTGGRLSRQRPFREPHHTSSPAAMMGGGRKALPGEISLAHQGVLFLDELPEFPRAVLESLRQPLETGSITVARANAHVSYPARFQLVAAMNPCRCGYLDDAGRACGKAPKCAMDYQSKISGPLLDRIDIAIELPEVPTLQMLGAPETEDSATVAARVAAARGIQRTRFEALGEELRTNAQAQGDLLQKIATPDAKGTKLLEEATQKFRLSMRGYTRVLRVARTLADLEGVEQVSATHIGEAVSYRQFQSWRLQAA